MTKYVKDKGIIKYCVILVSLLLEEDKRAKFSIVGARHSYLNSNFISLLLESMELAKDESLNLLGSRLLEVLGGVLS
jgi:hypothetical protein